MAQGRLTHPAMKHPADRDVTSGSRCAERVGDIYPGGFKGMVLARWTILAPWPRWMR